jgi:hypothetical protein
MRNKHCAVERGIQRQSMTLVTKNAISKSMSLQHNFVIPFAAAAQRGSVFAWGSPNPSLASLRCKPCWAGGMILETVGASSHVAGFRALFCIVPFAHCCRLQSVPCVIVG